MDLSETPTHHGVLLQTLGTLRARTRSALTYAHLEAERTPEVVFECLLESLECLETGLKVLNDMAAMSTEDGA